MENKALLSRLNEISAIIDGAGPNSWAALDDICKFIRDIKTDIEAEVEAEAEAAHQEELFAEHVTRFIDHSLMIRGSLYRSNREKVSVAVSMAKADRNAGITTFLRCVRAYIAAMGGLEQAAGVKEQNYIRIHGGK